jgi:cytochrome c-type biogenesis protein CcmH
VLDRVPDSIAAWNKAIALRPQDVGAKLGLAEVMVGALPDERGPLTPELAGLLREILALDPDQPDALFYLGQNEALEGRPQEARAHWQKLVDQLPEGSPARQEVENRLKSLSPAR